jgi:hypothetical protein
MDGEASTNGLDSTKHSADISIQGQMAADSGKRQVLIDWQQRILEVLWWGGGEPFRENLRSKQPGNAHVADLCNRIGNL